MSTVVLPDYVEFLSWCEPEMSGFFRILFNSRHRIKYIGSNPVLAHLTVAEANLIVICFHEDGAR
ncbi:hypothetical protein FOCC_FOCC014474 [Frankliniella occidentalis]|nr:hypothetical protein FOCC_FOCC014474 [Frankliniella occidentalis]